MSMGEEMKECYDPWLNYKILTKQCVWWDETKQTCLKNEPCPKPWIKPIVPRDDSDDDGENYGN